MDGKHASTLADVRVVSSVGSNVLWGTSVLPAPATTGETVAQFLNRAGLSWRTREGIDTNTANGDFGGYVGLQRGIAGAGWPGYINRCRCGRCEPMWPFNKTEQRAEGDYTEQAINAAEVEALGGTLDAGTLAVAEACMGLWERSLSSATVEPMNGRLAALDPPLLALVARSLALHGNFVALLELDGMTVRLLPSRYLRRSR